jgi:uncharacterized protein (TIGR02453 family)
MAFRGWPEEALEFYEGLEADNSKAYWHQNRSVYEEMVRGPMEELLAELEREFGEGRIFRPYRDIRFSPDKSPYKTHIGATLAGGGYVQLSARGLGAGSGMYTMAAERSGRKAAAIVAGLGGQGIAVTAHGELKTAPKGYPKDHPRIELLRLKGLVAWKEWPAGAWLGTARAKDRVVEFLRAAKPLNRWLAEHVGPSTLAGR